MHKIMKTNTLSNLNQLCLIATSIFFMANANAAANETVYVDSVHKWGAWALDIEPAAGGLQASNTLPLYARDAKVSLRTNSIAALMPPLNTVPNQPTVPTVPQIPITPPTVTPPSPPPGFGGPADGLF